MALDLRLYALIDPENSGGHDLVALVEAVAKGGATLIQLRDKAGSTRRMVERAYALSDALAPYGIPLVINDRVDVALAAEADGVHIGQDDMPVAQARLLLGKQAIIGLSLKTVEQAQAAPLRELSYVAIGGVFATTSKENTSTPVGLDGFQKIADVIRHRAPGFPICAIAGIDGTNAADVMGVGADGVAVISALSKASDPSQAAANLRQTIDTALKTRGGK
jgi:thiamine-phosphate pyrophosphorylase